MIVANKPPLVSIEDDGRVIRITLNGVAGDPSIFGSPSAMRKLRDRLTRAIVCAEVMMDMAPDESETGTET